MHISDKIQPKNLKQHFDWGGGPLATPLVLPGQPVKSEEELRSQDVS